MATQSPEVDIDRFHLTELVRKALDRPALQVAEWNVQPIHSGVEGTSALYRLRGEAQDEGGILPWSLILKIVKSSPQSSDPGGIWYWKREAEAYQSGLLRRLPGGNIGAPACYEVSEKPDGSMWLWLEEVKDDLGATWTIEQYAVAARHLGQFNGAYLVGQVIPAEPWITRNWLRQYVEHAATMIEFLHSNPGNPVAMKMFPGRSMARILATWDERVQMFDVLDNLPQVFCHQDAFKRNLFVRQGKTVVIDWGYLGMAPAGAELVALVLGSISMLEMPVSQVRELDRRCFEGYLQGLREAGWDGDPRQVRTGYVLTALMRYPLGGGVGEALPALLDPEQRAWLEAAFGQSADEFGKTDPAEAAYYQALLYEMTKLLGMKRLVRLFGRIFGYTLRLWMRGKTSRKL